MAQIHRTRARRRAATVLAALFALAASAAPAAADCPGASGPCPYLAGSQIGQRDGGVLRFPQTVAIGPDGSVYVGDQSSNVIQVFSREGVFQRAVGVAGTRPGELGPVGAVAVAGDNTLVVADGRDRIHHFAADGTLLNAFGSRGTQVGQFHFGAGGGHDAPAGGGLAIVGQTLFVSDSFNDRVQRVQLDGSAPAELIAPGQLNNPRGLTVSGTRLIVADDHNHRLAVYDTGGRFIRAIGSGQGAGRNQLSFPFGVGVDPQGRVFVADDINHRVVRFGPKSSYPYKARWGSYGTGPGQLAYPRALAVDSGGEIYVTNTGNDRIDVFDRTGTLLRSFGQSGRGAGQFNAPLGVGADANGLRAVVDSVNGRIELLNLDGSIAAVWGSPAPGPTVLPNPVDVVFDSAGNAYVLDQRRARIVVFDRASGLPSRTIGAQGSGPGRMLDPAALAIDAAGTLSVADTGNERIARFNIDGTYLGARTDVGRTRGIAVAPDGSRTYVAGTNSRITVFDAADAVVTEFGGVGTKLGKLAAPGQITLDAGGNLWVADRGNSRVQKFGPNGERLGAFGSRGTSLGEFINPTGVNVNCNGTLTVTDTKNNRVQQFALAAPAAAPCAPLGPIANPPVPKRPTLPTPLGPAVSVKVLRATGLFGSRNLPLRVGCDTVCTVEATATLTERTKPKQRRKAFSLSLRAVSAKLPAGETKSVRLVLSRTQVARLRKALGKRKGMTLTLQIVATADAGDPTTVSRRVAATG